MLDADHRFDPDDLLALWKQGQKPKDVAANGPESQSETVSEPEAVSVEPEPEWGPIPPVEPKKDRPRGESEAISRLGGFRELDNAHNHPSTSASQVPEEPEYIKEQYQGQQRRLDRNPRVPDGGEAIFRRVPPQNIDAEKSLLGSIFLEPSIIGPVTQIVSPTDFYRESHREIYKAMRTVGDEGIDAVTVVHQLRQRHVLDEVGGQSYIAELIACVPTSLNWNRYAEIVRECAGKRDIIRSSHELMELAYNGSTLPTLVEQATKIAPIGGIQSRQDAFPEPLKASAWYAREEELYSRVTWIWDNILEGGGISVLAGKKGHGKSTFARTLMLSAARGLPLLERNMRASKIWYIDMEPGGQGRKKLMEEMGWCDDDNLDISTGSPMAGKPGLFDWLKQKIEMNRYALVIVDTLYKLLKIEGTNDYDKGIYGQVPIEEICRATGVHFMLIHHARKNAIAGQLNSIAEEILGSASIAATAGTVMLIRKRNDVSTFQMDPPRYGEAIEGERVLKKLGGGWVEDAGSWGNEWLNWAKKAVTEALKLRGEDWSKAEDLDVMDMTLGKAMPVKTKKWILGKLFDERLDTRVERSGEGKRGDPYRYRFQSNGTLLA